MAASTTKLSIINRALQMLGQQSISNLNENSRGAKAMLRAYDSIYLRELELNVWNFATRRASLPQDVTAPIFGKKKYYPLPGDFLYLAPEETTLIDPRRRDFNIEIFNNTLCIVSDEDSPLHIRYVASGINESLFSALFAESLAAALAVGTCEEITNSSTKIATVSAIYTETVRLAKKRNAIQNAPVKSPTCSFITVRQ